MPIIINANYHSYTFPITRAIDNGLTENLLLSLQVDQTYKAYIVEYTLTVDEKALLRNENTIINLEDKVNYIELNNFNNDVVFSRGTGKCYEYWIHESPWGPTIIEEVEIPCAPAGEQDNTIDAGDSADGGGNTPNDSSPVGDDNTNNPTTTDGGTQTSGDPGGDGSSGGDGNSGDGDPSGDNTPEPDDDTCIRDANGQCIGDATTPVIKEPQNVDLDEKNCEELKKLGTTIPIRQSYHDIQGKVNLDREFGYSFALNTLPVEQDLAAGNSINLNMPSGGLIYGGSHTHPFESHPDYKIFPMFSIADIYKLGEIAIKHSNPGIPKNYSIFVLTMTVKNENNSETFAIKIDAFLQFTPFLNSYFSLSKKEKRQFGKTLNKQYEYTDKHGGGNIATNYLKDLFKFMNDKNINGVSIYKATNTNLTNWEKLNYDKENNTISDPTPCN